MVAMIIPVTLLVAPFGVQLAHANGLKGSLGPYRDPRDLSLDDDAGIADPYSVKGLSLLGRVGQQRGHGIAGENMRVSAAGKCYPRELRRTRIIKIPKRKE